MAIADDFSIALNGDIRHVSGTALYSVLELHRFLQDNADNASAATSDDLINITSDDPSSRATDQIITLLGTYNIDDTASQYLYGGSVRQGSGATEVLYSGVQVVGTVNDADTQIQVIQNNSEITNFWGNASTGYQSSGSTLNRFLIKSRDAGRDIDGRRIRVSAREYRDDTASSDTYAEFSATLGEGEAVAAIFTNNDLNNDTARSTVDAYDKHDNTEGYQLIDVDNNLTNEDYYAQWEITGAGSLPATPDLKSLYEYTKAITARGSTTQVYGMDGQLFRGITHSIIFDGDTGTWTQNEEIAWGTTMAYDNEAGGPFTVGEKLTFGTSGAVGTLLKLDDGGLTGELVVAIEPGTGTVVNDEQITGGTSGATADVDGTTRLVDTAAVGGTGALLAIDDDGVTGTMYIQLLTGAVPVNDLPLHGITSNSEAVVNGAPTSRTVSNQFLGTFTGSALIGSYGIALKTGDATNSDLFFPLDSATYPNGVTPPNNVTFTVSGLVSGDRLLLAKDGGGGEFDTTQMTVATTALTSATTTSIEVNAIPNNTPTSGNLRVLTDAGVHVAVPYSSFTGSTFTVTSTDFSTDNASIGNGVYIAYIDKAATGTSESFNTVFTTGNITLRARVREGTSASPIKEATGTGALSATGGSINVNRIADI